MTPNDVLAAAEQLVHLHVRFAPLFGKDPAQVHTHDYIKGLMTCPERKSNEPIALSVGPRVLKLRLVDAIRNATGLLLL